jgi:hypothetical protein
MFEVRFCTTTCNYSVIQLLLYAGLSFVLRINAIPEKKNTTPKME